MEEKEEKNKKHRKINILTGIIIILFVIILGLVFYIVIDKNRGFSNQQTEKTENEIVVEEKSNSENTNIEDVTKQIQQSLVNYMNKAMDTSQSGKNLLDDYTSKFYLITMLLEQENKTSVYSNGVVQEFGYVSYNLYKEKYEKVYGDSSDLDTVLKNGYGIISTDEYLGNGYIGWMLNWRGAKSTTYDSFNAVEVINNETERYYSILGTYNYTTIDSPNTIYHGNFEIKYAKNANNQKYLIGIILTNNNS